MSTTRIISAEQHILEEVRSLLAGVDYTRALVVFPGKRPSHFLRKALALEMKAGFIPPRTFSYDEFIQFLSKEHLGLKSPDLDPLDATSILYEIHCSIDDRLGGGYFDSYDQFLPLGFRLFDEMEELVLAEATSKRIQEEVGGLTFGNRHLLSSYFGQFYARLEKEGRLTRSIRLRTVAEKIRDIDFSGFQRIILAGFYALTPTDRRIFKSLSMLDQTALVYQQGPGITAHLEALGINRLTAEVVPQTQAGGGGQSQTDLFSAASAESGPSSREPEIHLVKSSDTHGQVFALSAALQDILAKKENLDERTVIVLPSSDALFPVLHQPLALLPEDAYNISLGFPLSRTPLYGLLRNLLDLVSTEQNGAVQAAAYIRFVLHPYVKNILFEQRTDVTRVLFHAIEEFLARNPATSLSLEELESGNKVFERVARGLSGELGDVSAVKLKEHLKIIHRKAIKPFLVPGTLGEFASKISDLVVLINNESTASLHPLFSRYAEKVIDVIDQIRRSDASSRRFDDRTSYAGFLRSYIGPQTVPFPGTPLRGIQVLGLLETRALSFDRVFVLDASDDVIPGARGTEMLVPQGMREKLGLETYKDREHLIEYYFSNLLSSAKEVYLFYSENNKQEKSRFIEKLLWKRQRDKKDAKTEPAAIARYNIYLANSDPSPIKKSGNITKKLKEFEFNATALDEYLKCQLRFYYHQVLGLREKEEVGDEIEQLDVGKLVHQILKSFFEPFKEKPLNAGDLSDVKMSEVVKETIEQAFGRNMKGSVFLLTQQTTSKLVEFLEDYQKKILETQKIEILGLEREVSMLKEGHHFTGRIDRIERRGDKTFILDYKIRQDDTPYKVMWKKFLPAERASWPEAIGSLQLPMYSLLYSEHSGEPIGDIVPAYVFLGRNYLDKTIETGLSKDGIVTEEMHQNLHRVILGLAKEIKDPSVPFSPTQDLKTECPGCPYQTMCGTQWAREGRW